MDTIPTEILLHILSFSIPSRRQRKVRRSLSRVCHFWCTAIYRNPVFWTEVRLHTTTEELQEILRRNSDGPLDVIWAPANSSKFIDRSGLQRVAMISSQSQRWRSLVLAGPIVHEIKNQLIQVSTPRLIELNIAGTWFVPQQFDLANEGALLRDVTLGGATLDWENSRLGGLRCLRLHQPGSKAPTVEQLHGILSSSPGLEILDLAWWPSLSSHMPPSRELGVILLPSLTTLASEEVPASVLHMLLSCIRAPGCRYIRLPSIHQSLFRGDDTLAALAKLCQGPLSTVPRLLVSYDRASGSCTITHRKTELAPQANIRESSVKLAKRRGVYLQTNPIFNPALDDDTLQSSEAGIRKFIERVVQAALSDLKVEIQLDLHHRWPRPTDTPENPPKSVVTDLLSSVPLVSHLRVRSYFDPMDVLPFISTRQAIRKMDGETGSELSWPIPLMESLTIACNTEKQSAVLEFLDGLISKRGSQINNGTAMAIGQVADHGEDVAFHSPRPLKRIILQDKSEQTVKE